MSSTSRGADFLPVDERVYVSLCALGYVGYALVATQPAHLAWAWTSSVCGGIAIVLSVLLPRRGAGLVAVGLGSTVVPLAVLLVRNLAQPEVHVLVEGISSLLSDGDLYVNHPATVDDFRPYLPFLFLYGLPQHLTGSRLVGPQVLVALTMTVALFAATRRLGEPGPDGSAREQKGIWLRFAAIAAIPLVGLAWTASAIDVPQTAMTIAAIAVLGRSRRPRTRSAPFAPVLAGLLVGATTAMKPTGLCAWFVIGLWVWRTRSRAEFYAFNAAAIGCGAVLIAPIAAQGSQMYTNVVQFPTDQAQVATPAATPFPGALLFEATGHDSRISFVVLALAAFAFALWCLAHKPATAVAAADQLAIGLALAFLLAPTARAGYMVLPLVVSLVIRSAVAGVHRDVARSHLNGAPDRPVDGRPGAY